jgi:nitronate monooxygenase
VFEEQVAALVEARPPVLSFIFGVPGAAILDRCRSLGLRTIATATTVAEARALDDAGVDAIVATGAEAGGHRPSFLRSAEASLMGTMALVPQVADAVRSPVIAAGGIADGRGVAAALALGAQGVQIGTAFLACDESNATPAHRAALRNAAHGPETMLTRGFTGRLGRGIRNALATAVDSPPIARLPYPFQGHLVGVLKQAALAAGRLDLVPFWSGQSAPLVTHTAAAALFEALVERTSHTAM